MTQPTDLAEHSARLEALDARARLAWAVDRWGDSLLMTSSFGPGSGALLHLWHTVAPSLPVHFIDTGFLFAETLAYRDRLVDQLGLSLVVLSPELPREDFLRKHGLTVYQDDNDRCCAHNKVAPMQRALVGKNAWVSGLRRDQSQTRADTPIVLETLDGPVKVHPLADWSRRDIYRYQESHHIDEHPLFAQGYVSVGCEPCTRPVSLDETDERAGRWAGQAKTECGLHTFLEKKGT
ncbi:MAG: phosphoadenylyl-sulfate reductase [Deltaproteobacteria bacterium]|nr:phosphoadenylyl-sulfate reductase [Deltaproteobacteria bacterium]